MPQPPSDFDGPWKESIEQLLSHLFSLMFPRYFQIIDWSREPVFLNTELQQIAIPEDASGNSFVDVLVKLVTIDQSELFLLIHIEVQSQRDPLLPQRMFQYSYRIRDKYKRIPLSLAIQADNSSTRQESFYEEQLYGSKVRFEFESVKLLDFRGQEDMLEQSVNPFAAVILTHLKTIETHDDPQARLEWKNRLVRRLLQRGLDKAKVRLLFRVIDRMMKLPPEQKLEFKNSLTELFKEQNMPLLSDFEIEAREIAMEKAMEEAMVIATEKAMVIATEKAMEKAMAIATEKAMEKAMVIATEKAMEKAMVIATEKAMAMATEKAKEMWLEKGIEQGIEQGKEKGILKGITIGLESKFGLNALVLIPKIQACRDVSLLEKILHTLWKAQSIDEIESLLPNSAQNPSDISQSTNHSRSGP